MTPRISNAYYHLQGEGHQCHFLKEIGNIFFIKAKIFIYINIKKKNRCTEEACNPNKKWHKSDRDGHPERIQNREDWSTL